MSPNGNTDCNGNNSPGYGNGGKYIEHRVSKMDTLAGIAIKYGVEVADIRRLNNLATDLQMFALKTLLIPLPGRHPPSPSLSNGSASPGENRTTKRPQRSGCSNLMESFQFYASEPPKQKVSPAMSSLQKFYGLRSSNYKGAAEGTEMAVYKEVTSNCFGNGILPKASPISDLGSNCRLRSRNSADDFLAGNFAMRDYMPLADNVDGESDKSNEKSVRRRQKAEADSRAGISEKFLKEENSGGNGSFLPLTGKSLAMRPKSANRTALSTDSDSGWLTSIPVGLGDSISGDSLLGVRKSSSTSSLQEQDNNSSISVWPTSKWSLKPDLQALSAAAITKPIFDGLPKPITGRRNKAALD